MKRARTTFLTAATLSLAGLGSCSTEEAPATEGIAEARYAPQNRPDVRGTAGAVSADHPLAAQVGLRVLQDGGTATDAIIAMAGVLAVVRPHMNGVGGDAFALFYDGATGEVTALNGSGRSGALATPAFFTEQGLDEIPSTGALSVSVPGAVAAWVDAHERYGTMPFADLFAPAIHYARDGFPVSTRLAEDFEEQGGALNEAGKALYLPGGSAPPVGSLLRNEALAGTLERIASDGKAGFYTGPVARQLASFVEQEGGHLREADFAAHTSTWVEPLRGDYLEHTFLVMPPNTQGLTQLALFEMAKAYDLEAMGPNTGAYLHTLVELKKLAFADRDRWIADPELADVPVDRLLDPAYLRDRALLVDPERAAESVAPGFGAGAAVTSTATEAARAGAPAAGPSPAAPGSAASAGGQADTAPGSAAFAGGQTPAAPATSYGERDDAGDTVYLTAVDRFGNAVSWIQSNFAGFGSGLLEPETGVLLQNRGSLYTLEDGHPNQVAPSKRPYHTLTPMMALRDGELAFTIGTPGGDSQTQSLLQIVNNLLLFGMTPQEAVEAPRFRSNSGLSLSLEDRVPLPVRAELEALGHRLRLITGWTATFGGAQMIYIDPATGTLAAAADPRREAYALAY